MGKPTGFIEYKRELPESLEPKDRIKHYKEIYKPFPIEKTKTQAARCMNCGVPFCHNGCPLGNIIPEFNDAVYENDWELAIEILSSTNNFPEFTGRICPAPCEASCVLGINEPAVAIEHIEKTIAERAFEMGLMKANPPAERTDKKVAIIGSGPAGLAAAAQLNKAGHWVTVFERADRIGGLLRYGIPDFKLEKKYVDRRIKLMEEEGITFKTEANVGYNIPVDEVVGEHDAIVLTGGSTVPRDLGIPGRSLKGIYFAMDFLTQNNKRVAEDKINRDDEIYAKDKHVIVIGGGDTGSDCVGTSNRHGAKSITQLEVLSEPPKNRTFDNPWPEWPLILRTSSSHEEGCDRNFAILTKEFLGEDGQLTGIRVVDIEWETPKSGERPNLKEIEGTERILPCDLAFLAIGFLHPKQNGIIQQLDIDLNNRGNVDAHERKVNDRLPYQTNIDNIFAAGDMRRGQSLVVWAIAEGREAARQVDIFLMGESSLEARDQSKFFVPAE